MIESSPFGSQSKKSTGAVLVALEAMAVLTFMVMGVSVKIRYLEDIAKL